MVGQNVFPVCEQKLLNRSMDEKIVKVGERPAESTIIGSSSIFLSIYASGDPFLPTCVMIRLFSLSQAAGKTSKFS